MLRTTLYDSEINTNRRNYTDFLTFFGKFFKQIYPSRARGLEEAATSGMGSNGSAGNGEGGTPDNPPHNTQRQPLVASSEDYGDDGDFYESHER